MHRPSRRGSATRSTPQHLLTRLQRQAATPECAEVAYERAGSPTAARLNVSLGEADTYVLATVVQLTPSMYWRSVQLPDQQWYDEYACYRDGFGWYVKVGETDDGLLVVSHHGPAHSITRIDGKTVESVEPSGGRP